MSRPSIAKPIQPIPISKPILLSAMPITMPANAADGTSFAWMIEPASETRMVVELAMGPFIAQDLDGYMVRSLDHDQPVSLSAYICIATLTSKQVDAMIGIEWRTHWTCARCGARAATMRKCSRCWDHYCSRDCSVADWPVHKGRCRALGRMIDEADIRGNYQAKKAIRRHWHRRGKIGCKLITEYEYYMMCHLGRMNAATTR